MRCRLAIECRGYAEPSGTTCTTGGMDSATPRSRKAWAVELHHEGLTQREIADVISVTQTSVWRWVHDLPPAAAPDELSVREAAERIGVSKEIILNAVKDGRLPARWGARTIRQGRVGPREQWIIAPGGVDGFVANAPACQVASCERPGLTVDGCCSREHSMKAIAERPWSAARRDAKRAEVTEGWHNGSALAEGMIRAKAGGRVRQEVLGTWTARRRGRVGGRAKGYTEDQARAVIAMKAEHPEYGRVTLSRRTGLSEMQIRAILAQQGGC